MFKKISQAFKDIFDPRLENDNRKIVLAIGVALIGTGAVLTGFGAPVIAGIYLGIGAVISLPQIIDTSYSAFRKFKAPKTYAQETLVEEGQEVTSEVPPPPERM